MRQAGRSLPEYRAIRGDGSILDAIARPDLAAEITLQPVRRYGVDAAVLFSDIVVPAHAVGFGIDVTPGTGPVAVEPLRHRARSATGCDRSSPTTSPTSPRPCSIVAGELDRRRARPRLRRRAVHRRQLPDRGSPESNVRAHQGARPDGRDAVARRHGPAGDDGRHVHRRPALGRAPRRSSCSTRGPVRCRRADYERLVLPHSRRVFAELAARHPDAPGIHFGIGCDHLLESMWAAGPRVIGLDWRTSIARRPRSSRRRRRGAGQPRPGPRAGRRRRRPRRHPRRAGRQRRPPGARLQPRPRCPPGIRPRRAGGDRRPRPRDDDADDHWRRADGVRHATAPEDIEAYYTDIRRGRPPSAEQLADLTRRYEAIGGLSPLAAITEAQRAGLQAALDERSAGDFVVAVGLKHADPKIEAGVATLAANGVERIVGLVLAPHFSALSVGEYLGRARGRRR